MVNGWFIGNFIPTAANFNKGEIAIKRYLKNHIESFVSHENACKVYVVISGEIYFNGHTLKPGAVICFDKGEAVSLHAVSDSLVLLVVLGDPKFIRGKGLLLPPLQDIYKNHFNVLSLSNGEQINSNQVSIVVQGAIDENLTKVALQSIRQCYPDSTIILSTWKGSNLDGLDFDECVLSDDPGTVATILSFTKEKKHFNNVNRQLVSTQNGLAKVKTKYVLKLRSDMIVLNDNLLRAYNLFLKHNNKYRIFKEKVAVQNLFSRRKFEVFYGNTFYTPFHISDWFYFGLTEDIRAFFSETPLMPENEIIYPKEKLANNKYKYKYKYKYLWHWKYTPEQYFVIKAVQRYFPEISFRDWTDFNEENIAQSDEFILNNFIILDLAYSGITMPKYEPIVTDNTGNNYTIPGLYRGDYYQQYYKDVIIGGMKNFNWDYTVKPADSRLLSSFQQ